MQKSLDELIAEVEQLFGKKDYQGIVDALPDDVLQAYNNALLYAWRGRAYYALNNVEEAMFWADKALQIDSTVSLGYLVRGNAWNDKKEYDKAIEEYTKAIALDEKNAIAYNNRGVAWSGKKEYDKAIEDYTRAIASNEKYADAYNNRGNAWAKKEEYDKAIEDFTKAIALDEKNAIAYNNRGNAWAKKEEYDKAIEDFTKAIALDEKDAIAYNNRGVAWSGKKEYDKAIEDYTKAILLDKKYADAYFNRGLAWLNKKKYDKAINDFTNVIGLDEKFAKAYYNLARCWIGKENYDKAIADYQNYIQLTGPEAYYSKIAASEIREIEKKKKDSWYTKASEMVAAIERLLLFSDNCITHYTSMSGAKAIILAGSKFRLSEGAFLNDTSEGRTLFNYLDYSPVIETTNDSLAETFAEKPFIGSFVSQAKHDDLTLWRMYGKENMVEAKGCALTIEREQFVSNLEKQFLSNEQGDVSSKFEKAFRFYRVAYIAKDNPIRFIIPGNEANEEELTKTVNELKTHLAEADNKQKQSIAELLNGIAFLFKSSDYQYEHEVRLIIPIGPNPIISSDSIPPKVYIELTELIPELEQITIGPKVERPDEWAAAFNYQIKATLGQQVNPVKIVISHLPFK